MENIAPSHKTPMDRSYWVIPGQLLAGAYPGAVKPDVRDEKLEGLVSAGIQLVINLMEPTETDWSGSLFNPYEEKLGLIAREKNLSVSVERYPVRDLDVPEKNYLSCILDRIDLALSENKPAYVHCWGGRGRTGTVVGTYLIRHGLADRGNVLSEIERLRSCGRNMYFDSPETWEQIRMVLEWQKGH